MVRRELVCLCKIDVKVLFPFTGICKCELSQGPYLVAKELDVNYVNVSC
jgi:hypothetical protein